MEDVMVHAHTCWPASDRSCDSSPRVHQQHSLVPLPLLLLLFTAVPHPPAVHHVAVTNGSTVTITCGQASPATTYAGGDYPLTVTATAGVTGCSDDGSATASLNVNPKPTITMSGPTEGQVGLMCALTACWQLLEACLRCTALSRQPA